MSEQTTKCQACGGHGEVGGLLPNGGGYQTDRCPDCNGSGREQAAAGAPEDRAYRDGYMQACREYEAHLCATGRLSPESRGWLFSRQKEIEARVKETPNA